MEHTNYKRLSNCEREEISRGLAAGQPYAWDANGNLLSDGTSNYTYDHGNRLEAVGQGGVTYTYAYNGDGDRLQQTVDGVTTNYTLDLAAGSANSVLGYRPPAPAALPVQQPSQFEGLGLT
ncbi:MAG: hypothetical protein HYZ26_08035 [Chloroflexi bacterium]|nr:hypothetical protein [Chloroflexota bacterium]